MNPALLYFAYFCAFWTGAGILTTLAIIAREPGLWWCAVRGVQRQHPGLNGGLLHLLYFASAAAIWPYVLYVRFFV